MHRGILLLTDHSLNFINLAAALVYTFTVLYAAVQLTLYYFDLEAIGVAEPRPGRRPPEPYPTTHRPRSPQRTGGDQRPEQAAPPS